MPTCRPDRVAMTEGLPIPAVRSSGHTGRPYEETEGGSVGARMARPEPGAIFARPSVDVPGSGGMWACRPTPTAVGGVLCTREASGRAMRAPTANGTIEPRRESGPGSGRPYRPPLRGNRRRVRRGGFNIRPNASAIYAVGPAVPAARPTEFEEPCYGTQTVLRGAMCAFRRTQRVEKVFSPRCAYF